MSDEQRPAPDPLTRWCEWCGGPFQQSATGRTRRYCRRSCRQRAYEHRQEQERIGAAVRAVETELLGSSRDNSVPVEPLPSPTVPAPAKRRVHEVFRGMPKGTLW